MRVSIKPFQWIIFFCFVVMLFTAWGLQSYWSPKLKVWAAKQIAEDEASKKEKEEEDAHAGHDHGAHDESSSLELSPQARKNIGLTENSLRPVELETFTQTISVPAIVIERPGRTRINIVAPMTGIVTNVNIIAGESILPGRPLFSIRLTHEDMVQAQTTFLKTLGSLDVEEQEIVRLESIVKGGAVPGKVLLERKYAKQKLEVDLDAQREALYLHGFSKDQVDQISKHRRLQKQHHIIAPKLNDRTGGVQIPHSVIRKISATTESRSSRTYVVQDLTVSKGTFVEAGDTLCVLADYSSLYIQGRAFEHDIEELNHANNQKWRVKAILENRDKNKKVIEGLKISYLDNQVEPESRAFHFYVNLPNKIMGKPTTSGKHQFLSWQFKPGQRLQLLIPIKKFEKKVIVLPVDAVASDGAERYVFQENGNHFDRIPVHVLYQDQLNVVIDISDSSIFPGDVIARAGAHQMQMALKNKAGGPVDPHAGHSH